MMRRLGLFLLAGVVLISNQAFGQQPKPPAIDYRPVISDLNAVVAGWNLKEHTNGNVALVAAVGCGSARLAVRDQYAAKLSTHFRTIAPAAGEKIDPEDFLKAEQRAFEKAGATKDAVALLTHRMKSRPSVGRNTFDESIFAKGVVTFEALSCETRVQYTAGVKASASKESVHRADCMVDTLLGLSVGVIDAVIAVFGAEVTGPLAVTLVSYFSGSWAWDELKDGLECK